MPMGQRALVSNAGEMVLDQWMVEEQSQLVMVLREAGAGRALQLFSQYRGPHELCEMG